MLESSSNCPTQEWIECAVINQYERLESANSAAGAKAMIVARGNGCIALLHTRCPLCSRTGQAVQDCREYRIIIRESKPNGMRHDGDAGNCGGENRQKDRNAKNWDSENKTDRPGCYFCQ